MPNIKAVTKFVNNEPFRNECRCDEKMFSSAPNLGSQSVVSLKFKKKSRLLTVLLKWKNKRSELKDIDFDKKSTKHYLDEINQNLIIETLLTVTVHDGESFCVGKENFVFFQLLVYTHGGKKAIKTFNEEWIQPLTFVCEVYETLYCSKNNDFSLNRIASCFPYVVCYLMKFGFGKTDVDMTFLENIVGRRVPKAILNKQFPSLLPKFHYLSASFIYIVKVYLFFSENNSTKRYLEKSKLVQMVNNYVNYKTNKSNFIENCDRIDCLKRLGLVNDVGKVKPEIIEINKSAKKIWNILENSSSWSSAEKKIQNLPVRSSFDKVEETGVFNGHPKKLKILKSILIKLKNLKEY